MTITVTDASSGLFYWLKTHANAASLRALVYGGATNILEEGDITPEILADAYNARHLAGQRSKVLAVTVHDAGEKRGIHYVTLRIYDRHEGYRNIRAFRDLFASIWENEEENNVFALTSVNGKRRGILFLEIEGRTGHVRVKQFVCDLEGIALSGKMLVEDE